MIYLDIEDKRIEYVHKKFLDLNVSCEVWNSESKKLLREKDILIFSPAKKFDLSMILNFPKNLKIFGGSITQEAMEFLQKQNTVYYNYLNDEIFTIHNATLTSEALLSLIIQKSESSIFECNILIIGGGRIGKTLANYFNRLGVNYSFFIFSEKDLYACQYYTKNIIQGFESINNFHNFDIVINTIPKMLFNDYNINLIKPNTLYFESASNDSIDESSKHFVEFIKAPRLPQLYSPISAGRLAFEFINKELKYE